MYNKGLEVKNTNTPDLQPLFYQLVGIPYMGATWPVIALGYGR